MADLGKIFIVSGPAGVGKSTVCHRLVEHFHGGLKRITTITTRPPRTGELNGIDYHFIDEATFLKYVAEEKFLEYANVYKKYFYGSPVASVLSNMRHGVDSLLIIDAQGIENIRKSCPHLVNRIITIFLMPENLDTLEERLKKRNSESFDDLEQRLKSAKHEIKLAKNYDYIIASGSEIEDFVSMEMVYQIEKTVQERAPSSFHYIYHEKLLVV